MERAAVSVDIDFNEESVRKLMVEGVTLVFQNVRTLRLRLVDFFSSFYSFLSKKQKTKGKSTNQTNPRYG